MTANTNIEFGQGEHRWDIPEMFNIGQDVCDKWADVEPERLAIVFERATGEVERLTFGALQRMSNQAANCLRSHGIKRGDRVGILLPQSPQTAAMHIAIYKSGAIAVPMFALFGQDALEFRLADSGCRALLTDLEGAIKIAPIRARLPELSTLLVTGAKDAPSLKGVDFEKALRSEPSTFSLVETRADDPAVIIYTSGTTGKPKGALHAHRTLLGHLPGVEMSHGGQIKPGDVFWTPADWAWIGGLLDVLLPALHHGVPVVAHRFAKFDAAAAYALMSRHAVTNVFLPPTAIKMLRADTEPGVRERLRVRSVASGGESLGSELISWGRETFGVTINEFYGQTECNMVVSSCDSLFAARPGAIGKAVPGHTVLVIDELGNPLPAGSLGEIAVQSPDPVMFLGYWNNPDATAAKFAGPFLRTGDISVVDADGYVSFAGRNDDVITSAGYRIGPGPIEDCLLSHSAVRMAAVVGKPDDQRTEIVKAFVILNEGFVASSALTKELQDHVRNRLAAHEYPRAIEYVNAFPMTATGKIIRAELKKR